MRDFVMPGFSRRHALPTRVASIATALGLACGAAVVGAGPAGAAEPVGTLTAKNQDNGVKYVYTVPSTSRGTYDQAAMPAVMTLTTGEGAVQVYCVELSVTTKVGLSGYRPQDWDTYVPQGGLGSYWAMNRTKILWVLANSAPTKDAAAVLARAGVTGVSDDMAPYVVRDATASTLWHYANGANLVATADRYGDRGTSLTSDNSPVYKLYSWFLANATGMELTPSNLSFSAAPAEAVAGTTTEWVTLSSTNPAKINATLPTGVTLRVKQGGADKTYTGQVAELPVTSGSTLALDVAKDAAAGGVDVTAQSTTNAVAQGMVWYLKGHQSLITAKSSVSTLTARTRFSWTAAPVTPPVTPPITPPATPPVAPVAPPATPVTPPITPVTPPVAPVAPPVTPVTPPITPVTPPVAPVAPPIKPVEPVKPVKPTVQTVRRTFQVDRYLPKTAVQAKALARFDDDGRLEYREDAILWGASRHQFVTVTVPTNATSAQLIAAINAATSRQVGDVRATMRLAGATAGSAYVVAWELGTGATTRAPWGANRGVAQTFLARS